MPGEQQQAPDVRLIPAGTLRGWPHDVAVIRTPGDRPQWRGTNGSWLTQDEVEQYGQRWVPAPAWMETARLLGYLLTQYDHAVEAHALVRMDTEQGRGTHRRVVEAMQLAAEPVREWIASLETASDEPKLREGDPEPACPVRDRYGRRWTPETRIADDFVGWVYRPPGLEPHWATWGQLTVQLAPLTPEVIR